MKTRSVLAGIAGFVLSAAAGMALADNQPATRTSAYFAPGKHQFYVWCSSGQNRTAYQSGASAQDAQTRLYEAQKATDPACWPVWQGRVSS